ncbi:MAG TPA: hypothetical protein PLM79_06275 [Syntrophobacteraceae bacterium]|nr:hypothetical protein [Syntrophobacteraceae bacterium]
MNGAIAGNVVKIVVVVLLTSAFWSFSHAGEGDLKAAAKVLADGVQPTKEISDHLELYKKAGITYQPDLPVPLKDIADCKSQEQLRVLMGMYAFELGYAMAFEKRKELLETSRAIQSEIVDRLEIRDKLDVSLAKAEPLGSDKEEADGRGRDELLENQKNWIMNMIEKAENDPQVMELLMDIMYGGSIEGLHVICNIALNAEKGDALIALLNQRASRLEIMDAALKCFNDKDLASKMKKDSRVKFSRAVIDLVKAKKGALTREDMQQILALVEPERNIYVKKCE